MKAELKLALTVLLFGFVLGVAGIFIKNKIGENDIISPLTKPFGIFSFLVQHKKPNYIVYGYLPYWSLGSSKYLQYDRLTDIAYFGLYLNDDGNFQTKVENDQGNVIDEPGYDKWKNDSTLQQIIERCKKDKTRFALTVISHEDEKTDKFLDCRTCWDTLLNNLKSELKSKGIKDVNLNFEYAEYTDGDKAEKFAELTKFINERLDAEFGESFVVVSAFADSAIKERVSSKLNELGRYSDGIFIMAYDFFRRTSDTAGPVSPIDGSASHAEYDINSMLKDFLSQIAPNKLILGVPYYGYNWVVENDHKYAKRVEGDDAIGFSESLVYDKILTEIDEVKAKVEWDDVSKEPYYSYISPETESIRQVFFENKDSLRVKYQMVKASNLGGIGIWALGYDGDRPELWDLIGEEFVK